MAIVMHLVTLATISAIAQTEPLTPIQVVGLIALSLLRFAEAIGDLVDGK